MIEHSFTGSFIRTQYIDTDGTMSIDSIVKTLTKSVQSFTPPLIDIVSEEFGHDPFLILIACLLSLRAKDTTTIHVCRDLFTHARTPQALLAVPRAELERIVFRTGFYKTKARVLHEVSQDLIERFNGRVPDTSSALLSIKGVGLKTAHLVVGCAFGKPAICVDTHVHRISNRLGLITTKTPEQTEEALRKVLPKKYWTVWNNLLVVWGQNVCVPLSPKCSQCSIRSECKRVGVKKSR